MAGYDPFDEKHQQVSGQVHTNLIIAHFECASANNASYGGRNASHY